MEMCLSVLIKSLIMTIYDYNRMVQFRNIEDSRIGYYRGKVDALMDALKELGHPVTWGYGALWSSGKSKYENGYGYITFSKSDAELKETDIYETHGFENGIYWFIDGNGYSTAYKGGK